MLFINIFLTIFSFVVIVLTNFIIIYSIIDALKQKKWIYLFVEFALELITIFITFDMLKTLGTLFIIK
jgi:hypothetical protein